MSDAINPSHYRQHPSGYMPIDLTEHLPTCIGDAVKYLWRMGLKDSAPEMDDLRKARWYLVREKQRRAKWPCMILALPEGVLHIARKMSDTTPLMYRGFRSPLRILLAGIEGWNGHGLSEKYLDQTIATIDLVLAET